MPPTRTPFLRAAADAFAERVLACLDEGALALLISIGHRTGLFDGLGAVPSLSPVQLAQRSGLDERYVTAWLEAVHAGGIVEFHPKTGRYSMPPEHAACLSRDGGRRNVTVAAQWIAGMGGVEDAVIEHFVRGGPGELSPRADAIAEEERELVARSRMPRLLRRIPGLRNQLERGIDVLDLDSGKGTLVADLAETYPRSRIHGRDIASATLETSRAELERRGLTNACIEPGCIIDLEEVVRRFDLVIWSRLSPRGGDSEQIAAWCYRALRRRGTLVVVDRLHPDDRPSDAPSAGTFQRALACLQLLPGVCETVAPDSEVLRKRGEVTAMLITHGFSSVEVVRTDDRFYSTYVAQR